MKRVYLFLLGAVFTVLSTVELNAQREAFSVGDTDLNLQLGFGSSWYLDNAYKSGMPLLSASFDYGLHDQWGPGVFGLGGLIGISTNKYEVRNYHVGYGTWGYKNTYVHMAARATYHYQFVPKLDTYGGVLGGFSFVSSREYGDYRGSDDGGVDPLASIFVGAKYRVSPNFAVMSELYAYDLAFFNIGVSFKL